MALDRTVETLAPLIPEPDELYEIGAGILSLLQDDRVSDAMERYSKLLPPDQADVMARLSSEYQAILLEELTHYEVGEIIQELDTEVAVEISEQMEPKQLSQVLDVTAPSVAADVLRALPEGVAEQTLENMERAENVASLLEYEEELAGTLMMPNFVAVRVTMNARQAMALARRWAENHEPKDVAHLFVVDQDDVLVGEFSLGRLLIAPPDAPVSHFMSTEVISIPTDTDQEAAVRLMERYKIQNLPVVDEYRKLVGILRLHDMVSVIQQEATEDMYKMMGVHEGEKVLGPFWRSIRSRLPWLFIYTATAFLSALAVGLFETTIAKVVVLAVFLNVVPGHGGQGGVQTMTLVVRGMALGEIPSRLAFPLLSKEVAIAATHGLLLGIVVGIVAYFWKGDYTLGLILGVAMVGNMVVAALTGVGVPLILRWAKQDPAVSSAVFVTTFTDVLGVIFFLGLATLAVNLLQ